MRDSVARLLVLRVDAVCAGENAVAMLVQNNCVPKHREDVLRNGLKFENDRKFKNRLMLKTILLMTVLVTVATCGFVAWSKLKPNDSQPVKVTTIIRKVGIDYDLDVESVDEHVVLPEIRTEFVPPLTSITDGHTRVTRDVAKQQKPEEIKWNATADYADEGLEEIVWVKTSDKTKRNIYEKIEPRNLDKQFAPERSISQSTFWTAQGNAESIRQSQADRMLSFMDPAADPCDDFYQFSCGRWNEQNSIPEDRGGFDTFQMLRDNLEIVLRDLLLEADQSPDDKNDTAVHKAKILYRSCMNEESIEKLGNQPLLDLISSLGGWPVLDPNWNETGFDWIEMTTNLRLYFNDMIITFWVGQDLTSAVNIIMLDQTSLGLLAREYFLEEKHKSYKDAYRTYFTKVAILLGADPATAESDGEQVINFETALANITSSLDQRRNISIMYKKMTLGRLEVEIPHIKWRRYLSRVLNFEVSDSEPVVIYEKKFFMLLGHLLESTPPRTVANYIMWRFVKHRINNLSEKFQDLRQDYVHVLYGREKKPPRWNMCVQFVNSHMGMALGSMFVRRYFDETSKNNTVIMTQSIMDTFKDILEGITWIKGETRKLAQEKVKEINLRIGYPDFILDHNQLNTYFENMSVTENQHFANTLNVLQFMVKLERMRLRTVVNRTDWITPPAIVNAYYSRNRNQIIFPAGILQPPFYHRHFPQSLNYGGIGAVIGHELIHGFDDKGQLYDTEGNLNSWWKEDEVLSFRSKIKCLIDQYSSYTVQEVDMPVDGVNTQGENIADNGGIKQAFRAYEKWIAKHGDANETLAGVNFTNYQLFFVNFAQIWCGSMRPEVYRTKIQTSQHTPGRFRVIGPLSNSEEFARVFNCSINSNMNPKDKCHVW